MTLRSASDVVSQLDLSVLDTAGSVYIKIGSLRIRVVCVEPLYSELKYYFSDVLVQPGEADLVVNVLEGQSLKPQPEWNDWSREPGKTGRKDAYLDLEDARLIHKLRTGVTFLQSPDTLIAFGSVNANPNQVINFINTQALSHYLRQGWQICHAAAVTNSKRTLAIAGLSGGGKSTSVLKMMEIDGTAFVSNDRLMVAQEASTTQCLGIPKHPRINPGTILHNKRLHPLLDDDRLEQLAQIEPSELWELEEKYDLIIPELYGAGRFQLDAELTDFWVLNWEHDAEQPTLISEVSLSERPDLLSAIMKSAGPFYQDASGNFLRDAAPVNPAAYISALQGVRVYEVSGRIDFDVLQDAGTKLFRLPV